MSVSAHARMTGSQYSSKIDGKPMLVRTLGQAHGHEAALGVAADLGRGQLGVGEVGDAERDEPLGVLLPPLLVHPVVVRTGDGVAELRVLGRASTRGRRSR